MAEPYVQLYTSDFLAGTSGMTASTKGVYITLLCLMYESEAPLGQSWDLLARRCGCTMPAFKRAILDLQDEQKVTVSDAGIWSDKCDKHIARRRERRSSAKAAAEKRWEKSEQKQGKADANAMPAQCQPEPEPDIKETPKGVSKKKRGTRLPEDWRLPRPWDEWAQAEGFSADTIRSEADKFKDYWISTPGQKGVKLNWQATWRNWMRNSDGKRTHKPAGHAATDSFLAGWGLDGSQDAGGSASDSHSMRDVTPPGSDRMAAGQDWNAPGAILRFPTSAGNGPSDF